MLEGGDRGKRDPVGGDLHLFPRQCLLLRQAMQLPLLSNAAKDVITCRPLKALCGTNMSHLWRLG